MPFVNMKKASSQAGGGKSFAVRVTTMDAELEFSYIEVCSLKTTQHLHYMFTYYMFIDQSRTAKFSYN